MSESEFDRKIRKAREYAKKDRAFRNRQIKTDMEMLRRQHEINRLSSALANAEGEKRRAEHLETVQRAAYDEKSERPRGSHVGRAKQSPWAPYFFYKPDFEIRGRLADGLVTSDTLQAYVKQLQIRRFEDLRLGYFTDFLDFEIDTLGRMLRWMEENKFTTIDYLTD